MKSNMKTKRNKISLLGLDDINDIMDVEKKAFIPSIKTTRENIERRLKKGHVYLGMQSKGKTIGTLAFRYAYFIPDMKDFAARFLNFSKYAESPNELNANAVFVYSLGVVPSHRNGVHAKNLIEKAMEIGENHGMGYLVGDARIPSYNGSKNLPYEQFEFNLELHRAVDGSVRTGELPERHSIEQDPVAGFYLRIFPQIKVLSITDKNFWKHDEPCGGRMCIIYQELKKLK